MDNQIFAEIQEINSNNSWIIIAQEGIYNHAESFKKGYIDWVKINNFREGDFVFIYFGVPQRRVRYLTRVDAIFEKGQLPLDAIDEDKKYWKIDHDYDKAHVRLRLLKEMEDNDDLSEDKLRENGLAQIRSATGPSHFKQHPELCEYLKQIFLGGSSNGSV